MAALHVFKGVNRVHPASRIDLLKMLKGDDTSFQFFEVRTGVYLAVFCTDALFEQLRERFPRMEPVEAIPADVDVLVNFYYDRY